MMMLRGPYSERVLESVQARRGPPGSINKEGAHTMPGLHFSLAFSLRHQERAARLLAGCLIIGLLLALGGGSGLITRPGTPVSQRGLHLPLSFEPNVGQADAAVRF